MEILLFFPSTEHMTFPYKHFVILENMYLLLCVSPLANKDMTTHSSILIRQLFA